MSVLRPGAVMGDLATACQTVLTTGHTAYGWPTEGARQGDVVINYPTDPVTVSVTFRRGMDRGTFSVWRLCGLAQDEATTDEVDAAVAQSSSLISAIESYAGTWSSVAVTSWQIETYTPIGQPPLVALRLDVDVLS